MDQVPIARSERSLIIEASQHRRLRTRPPAHCRGLLLPARDSGSSPDGVNPLQAATAHPAETAESLRRRLGTVATRLLDRIAGKEMSGPRDHDGRAKSRPASASAVRNACDLRLRSTMSSLVPWISRKRVLVPLVPVDRRIAHRRGVE